MIALAKLMMSTKDLDSMVTRKVSGIDHHIQCVAVNKKTGKAYNVDIELNTPKMELDSNCKVSCTCEDFKFRWAYVLWQQDALLHPKTFILTPPEKTNPNETLNACKHIHAFIHNEMIGKLRTMSTKNNQI